MPDNNFIQRIITFFNFDGSKKETSYVPESLKEEILNELEDGETLLKCVQSLSSTYKPKNWLDRNTFFNTFLIFTSKRLIVARNSRELKIFRDIDINQIQKYKFNIAKRGHNIIEIQSFDSRDKIVIHKTLTDEVEELKQLFTQQIDKIEKGLETNFIYCKHCGIKIPFDSTFCSSCGKKVKV